METAEVTNKTKWTIDPSHSEISSKVKHLMISNIKGVFREFTANIYSTNNNLMTSDIDIVMNVSSIDTGDKKRDEHLKSADFFHAKKFMQIVFSGSSFEKTDKDKEGKYILHGILTIKGITKKITLDAEFGGMIRDPWGNDRSGFSLKGTLNRKDWGLNWNTILDTGGLLIGEDVNINCEVELIKANIEKNVN